MEDGTEDGVEDSETEDGTDTEDGTSEGLPGFGAIAAIVSLAAVAVYTRRRGSD
jgi:PGF-CTERM protein